MSWEDSAAGGGSKVVIKTLMPRSVQFRHKRPECPSSSEPQYSRITVTDYSKYPAPLLAHHCYLLPAFQYLILISISF
ncbi:hypothetical protein DC498_25165 [Terrimonas sp.]|nr:hypothetical protein DC498_25165 [Terrimonas sp.]